MRRKGGALILREIHPEYVMPVGSGRLGKASDRRLKERQNKLRILKKPYPLHVLIYLYLRMNGKEKVKRYRSKREQLRITDFFRNNNDLRMARDTS